MGYPDRKEGDFLQERKMSVILATDTYATIRQTLARWRQQTLREQIELILVAPSENAVREATGLENNSPL